MTAAGAPYCQDIATTCPRPSTAWLHTDDGIRLRTAIWSGGHRGTVVLFNGRTEYIEKYAFLAEPFMLAGFTLVMHDWRGHGLSDRLHRNPDLCHIESFADYQIDVAAVLAELKRMAAPQPYHIIAHSMGGCIALRTLHHIHPFQSAIFLAPMWGFCLNPIIGSLAVSLSALAGLTGYGGTFVPGTNRENYVLSNQVDRNALTSCSTMFHEIRQQILTHPELSLGGPSYAWLRAALQETADLRRRKPPAVPALAFLGAEERVVDPDAIHSLMAAWSTGTLHTLPNCRHELLMEGADVRQGLLARMLDFLQEQG
ncbi:MAG: alpha/beta hydrolase [Rhodobacteraceae bacterium]|nr:alpha/beta hydrolase [Paracoccaceae bacterium]